MNKTEYTDYSPIEWKAGYSVEVPELDRQHKELMNFYNGAIVNCSGDETEEKVYFDRIIDVFINFLSKHFKTEENFLPVENRALYEEHKLEHTKLMEKIRFIKNEIENNRWRMNLYILSITLKDMLMYHLNLYDISAKEYLREGNIVQEAEENCLAFQA